MKIILINPGVNFNTLGKYKKLIRPMPPTGVAYIAACLKKHNIEVRVIDDYALHYGLDNIRQEVKSYNPHFVGISCLTPSAPYSFKLCKLLRELNPDIKIVMGNLHASLFYEEILRSGIADYVVHGDGERPMLEIVESGVNKENLKNIRGVSYIDKGKLMYNAPLFREDLDDLPYPDWSLFPLKKYLPVPYVNIGGPVLTITASRGCPYSCSFCSVKHTGEKYRKRKPEKVVEEIKFLKDIYKTKFFGFIDPIFPFEKEYCMEICEGIIKNSLNKKMKWFCETRVDRLEEKLLTKMKEGGCQRIILGMESAQQETLYRTNKNYSIEQAREVLPAIKKAGIEVSGLFMIGFPWETHKDIEGTITFAQSLPLDFAKFALFVPFPGSKLYADLLRKGNFNRTDWENYSIVQPDPEKVVYVPEGFRATELISLQKRAMRKFYFRFKIILNLFLKVKYFKIRDILYGLYAVF